MYLWQSTWIGVGSIWHFFSHRLAIKVRGELVTKASDAAMIIHKCGIVVIVTLRVINSRILRFLLRLIINNNNNNYDYNNNMHIWQITAVN